MASGLALALPLLPSLAIASEGEWKHCVCFDSNNCLREYYAEDGETTWTSLNCFDGDPPYETQGGYAYGGCPSSGSEVGDLNDPFKYLWMVSLDVGASHPFTTYDLTC